jgi:hypothetical protein
MQDIVFMYLNNGLADLLYNIRNFLTLQSFLKFIFRLLLLLLCHFVEILIGGVLVDKIEIVLVVEEAIKLGDVGVI